MRRYVAKRNATMLRLARIQAPAWHDRAIAVATLIGGTFLCWCSGLAAQSGSTPPASLEAAQVESAEGAAEGAESPAVPGVSATSDSKSDSTSDARRLRFSFQYAPWKEVLDWLSQESDLALSLESPPSGTFNYTDTRFYTTGEAIDVVNSLLLIKGYTLVRREKMLLLVNLEDGIPPNLVTQVMPDQLDELGNYELVSCLFELERFTPEEAQDELGKLLGPQGSMIVLPTSRQVIVTETAGKLRTIRRILQKIENPTEAAGTKITPLLLKHITPDEALAVIRQLMNIPEDSYATEDGTIRLSVDAMGTRLLAKATPNDIAELRDILSLIDVPSDFAVESTIAEAPQLLTYPVQGANPETAMQVLQTLLAGMPDVRLSLDPLTNNLVALARPPQHATIRVTLEQLAAEYDQIEIFRLRVVDPTTARLAVESLFGIKAGEEHDAASNAPRVDVDLNTKQLLVRGRPADVDRIRGLLDKMGESQADTMTSDRGNIRMLPLYQGRSDELLRRLEAIWPTIRKNPIRTVTPSAAVGAMHRRGFEFPPGDREPKVPGSAGQEMQPISPVPDQLRDDNGSESVSPTQKNQRQREESSRGIGVGMVDLPWEILVAQAPLAPTSWQEVPNLGGDRTDGDRTDGDRTDGDRTDGEGRSTLIDSQGLAEIIVAPGPGGLLIASDDVEALDEFESLLSALSDPALFQSNEYTVCYLRYAKASEAAALLNALITGKSAADDSGGGGGMLGGLASMALGGMGSLFDSAASSVSFGGGVQIIPDARINALFVKAAPADVDLVRQLLEIIDQPHSPEDVETTPAPRLIPVFNTSAEEIANVVRDVYANRLASASGEQAGRNQNRQPNVQEIVQAMRGGRGQGGGDAAATSVTNEPPLTIGVDPRSNSLVVSAPDPLFVQIEALVSQLDDVAIQSNETTRVVTVMRSNPETIRSALNSLFGEQVKTVQTGKSNGQQGGMPAGGGGAAAQGDASRGDQEAARQFQQQMRRRMELFNNLRRQQEGQRDGRGGRGGGGNRR